MSTGWSQLNEENTGGQAAGEAAGKSAYDSADATSRTMFEAKTAQLSAAIAAWDAGHMLADNTTLTAAALSAGEAALVYAQRAGLVIAGAAVGFSASLATGAMALGALLSCPGDSPVDGVSQAAGQPVPAPKELDAYPGAERASPKTPVQGGGKLRARWVDQKGGIYEWDSRHGTVERYNNQGRHIGEFDPKTGAQLKPANPKYRVQR